LHSKSRISKELSETEIRGIVRAQLGVDGELRATLRKGGLFNTTYKIVAPSAGREWILRAGPVHREYLMGFERNLMEAERQVYDLFARSGVPCPVVVACDTSKTIVDRDYMITEYIESVPLSDEAVPEAAKIALYEQAGAAAAKMHGIRGAKFGRVSDLSGGGGNESWGGYLAAHVAELGESCLRYAVLDKPTVTRIVRLFDTNAALYAEIDTPRLVHADLWAGNVLVRPTGANGEAELAAIIDADRAIFGDVDFEFASPWMINEAFLKGYGERGEMEADRSIRIDTYKLIYYLIDTYVWKIQYDNDEEHETNKRRMLEMLDDLERRLAMRK